MLAFGASGLAAGVLEGIKLVFRDNPIPTHPAANQSFLAVLTQGGDGYANLMSRFVHSVQSSHKYIVCDILHYKIVACDVVKWYTGRCLENSVTITIITLYT